MKKPVKNNESGNAFFIVMLTVVLFAALMYTFSRGIRQGSTNLTEKQAKIEASDIITYAQKVERGVQRVYSKGYSENNISFENSFFSGPENASCTDDRCRVFSPTGGGISYRALQDAWSNSATHWIFTGHTQVLGIGNDCAADNCVELLMMIEDVPNRLCQALNEELGVTGASAPPPADAGVDTVYYTSVFNYDGSADIGDEDVTLSGETTGCLFETGNVNYFYHTLLAR